MTDTPDFPAPTKGPGLPARIRRLGQAQPLARLRGLLKRHYLALGAGSRRLRFLLPADDAYVIRTAESAAPELVLVLEIEGQARGVLEMYEAAPGHAEIGISLEDAWQGRGYGARLFDAGLKAAAARGIRTADLFFSRDNTGIKKLVRRHGGRIEQEGADCAAQIELPRPAGG